MARPVLPTDFKDDILAESMSGKRRYRIIQNADGTVSFDDVTDYEQVGSTFGAKQVNDMSSAVNSIEDVKAANNCTTTEPGFVLDARQGKTLMDKSNELSRDLKFPDGVGFYPDIQDGVRGYNTDPKRGADTFTPFKKAVNLGTGTRFDVSLYSNHKKFTADNFIIKIERVTTSQSPTDNDQDNGNAGVNISPTVSYDAEKGIVTVSRLEGIGRFKTYGSTGCIIKSKVEVSVWLIF